MRISYSNLMKTLKIDRIVKYWLPVFVWALVIFLFSSRPTGTVSEIHWGDFILKKTAHIVEYAILSVLTYRALVSQGFEKKRAGFYSIAFSILYGFTDEFHQSFTPGRDARLRDVFIDATGAVLAIYFVWKLLPQAPKRLRTLAEKLEIK